MTFGQARQDDLLEYLPGAPADDLGRHLEALQIDLSRPAKRHCLPLGVVLPEFRVRHN